MKRRDFIKGTVGITGAGLVLGNVPVFSAFAQSETPTRGGTLIWGHSETTQNLDIHQTGTASTLRLLQNVHDSILTVDSNFTIQPSRRARTVLPTRFAYVQMCNSTMASPSLQQT